MSNDPSIRETKPEQVQQGKEPRPDHTIADNTSDAITGATGLPGGLNTFRDGPDTGGSLMNNDRDVATGGGE